jgi:RNA polymerase sigma factor (sigma-70 family)
MNQSSTWTELVNGCLRGHNTAQMEMYRRSWRAIFPAICRMVIDRNEAEDILQESIIKGFERLGDLKNPEAYIGWQKRMAMNDALMRLRKKGQWKEVDLDKIDEAEEEVPEDEVDQWNDALKLLEELPQGYRIVIGMHLLDDLKHEEIGELLGVAASSVRSQYSRGLQLMKKRLHEKQIRTVY